MAYQYAVPEKNHLPPDVKLKIAAAINEKLKKLDASFDKMTATDLAEWFDETRMVGTDKHTFEAFKLWYREHRKALV